MDNKNIFDDLFTYDFCKSTKIDDTNVQLPDNSSICSFGEEKYLCEWDEYVNTRILLRIFKCVNLIKNILIVGLICGVVGVILSFIK